MEPIIFAILVGILAGLTRVTIGYLKNPANQFNKNTALRTTLIAMIEGGIIGAYFPMGLETLFAVVFMGTVTVEEALLAIRRRR